MSKQNRTLVIFINQKNVFPLDEVAVIEVNHASDDLTQITVRNTKATPPVTFMIAGTARIWIE